MFFSKGINYGLLLVFPPLDGLVQRDFNSTLIVCATPQSWYPYPLTSLTLVGHLLAEMCMKLVAFIRSKLVVNNLHIMKNGANTLILLN